jgi:hypothetical protein
MGRQDKNKRKNLKCWSGQNFADWAKFLLISFYKIYHCWVKTLKIIFRHLIYPPGLDEGSVCVKRVRTHRINCCARSWPDGIRKTENLNWSTRQQIHPHSVWLSDRSTSLSQRRQLKHCFLSRICVRLASLLWARRRERTSRCFRHWWRTWGYACQLSDPGQEISWDIARHRFPTDVFMLI